MSKAGDWAFSYALELAVEHDVRLDVFFFPQTPGEGHPSRGRRGELADLSSEQKVSLEKDFRLYYDKLLGDFVNVGFRLCEGDEDPELRRCLLIRKEYDVLVVPYEAVGWRFGTKTIEEFAESMPCPAVLVGPDRPDQFAVNSAARLWLDRIGLEGADVRLLEEVVARG
jgi:hypothetical protein